MRLPLAMNEGRGRSHKTDREQDGITYIDRVRGKAHRHIPHGSRTTYRQRRQAHCYTPRDGKGRDASLSQDPLAEVRGDLTETIHGFFQSLEELFVIHRTPRLRSLDIVDLRLLASKPPELTAPSREAGLQSDRGAQTSTKGWSNGK